MYRWMLAFGMLALATAGARGEEEPKSSILADEKGLLDYARNNPGCFRYTDLCRTCVRDADKVIRCSMPGIACVKQTWTCTEKPADKP